MLAMYWTLLLVYLVEYFANYLYLHYNIDWKIVKPTLCSPSIVILLVKFSSIGRQCWKVSLAGARPFSLHHRFAPQLVHVGILPLILHNIALSSNHSLTVFYCSIILLISHLLKTITPHIILLFAPRRFAPESVCFIRTYLLTLDRYFS